MAASLAAINLHAQVPIYGAPPQPEPAPAVVYQAPVVYQVPVVYQAPVVYQTAVVYQAPVIYEAPVMYEAPVFYGGPGTGEEPTPGCCPPAPTVIYFGGPYSACHNAQYQCNASPVIYFGRGEGCQRGYQFSRPR